MPKFIIERNIPGASNLSAAKLQGISAKSNSVLREPGPSGRWQHSYVAGSKIYCVYLADHPEIIREHARCGGFPCDQITQVCLSIDSFRCSGASASSLSRAADLRCSRAVGGNITFAVEHTKLTEQAEMEGHGSSELT
jgi:hypothetical protein